MDDYRDIHKNLTLHNAQTGMGHLLPNSEWEPHYPAFSYFTINSLRVCLRTACWLVGLFPVDHSPLQLLSESLGPILWKHIIHVIFFKSSLGSDTEKRVQPADVKWEEKKRIWSIERFKCACQRCKEIKRLFYFIYNE